MNELFNIGKFLVRKSGLIVLAFYCFWQLYADRPATFIHMDEVRFWFYALNAIFTLVCGYYIDKYQNEPPVAPYNSMVTVLARVATEFPRPVGSYLPAVMVGFGLAYSAHIWLAITS